MTENQKGRINELAAYVRDARTQEKVDSTFCTNILAFLILIEKDE